MMPCYTLLLLLLLQFQKRLVVLIYVRVLIGLHSQNTHKYQGQVRRRSDCSVFLSARDDAGGGAVPGEVSVPL